MAEEPRMDREESEAPTEQPLVHRPRTLLAWVLSIVIALIALAFALARAFAAEPSALRPSLRPALVATTQLEARPHALTLPAKVGVLEAAVQQTLGFPTAGRLERILGEGARVREGDEIAALESRLEQADVRRAELLLKDAESELRRAMGLRKSNAASRSTLESARTAVGLRRAELDVARERLEQRSLVARFGGVLADVRIEPGEIATPGTPIADLLNFELMKIEVGVAGYQIGRVHPGARVMVEVPALPGQFFTGQVHNVAPSTGNGDSLFEVKVIVPNSERRLRPGMSARSHIVTEERPLALVVPLESVVERSGERVVFFVEGDRAVAVGVSDMPLHGDELILPGSLPYRELVVRGQHDLRDGFAVRKDNSVLAGRTRGLPAVTPGLRTP